MHPKLLISWIVLNLVGAAIALLVRMRDTERQRAERRADNLWMKYGSYFLITGGVLYLGSCYSSAFKYALMGLGLGMWRELSDAAEGLHKDARRLVMPVGAALIGAGIFAALCIKNMDLTGDAWGWFWLVVATTDAYSQLFGQGWGEAKMAPRLSPGKTWFGFFMGTFFATFAGVAMGFALYPAGYRTIFAVALVTSLAATAGDLVESWMKRVVCVKDFSSILGTHGGLLDRFDSLLGAAPVFAVALWWLDNVSR